MAQIGVESCEGEKLKLIMHLLRSLFLVLVAATHTAVYPALQNNQEKETSDKETYSRIILQTHVIPSLLTQTHRALQQITAWNRKGMGPFEYHAEKAGSLPGCFCEHKDSTEGFLFLGNPDSLAKIKQYENAGNFLLCQHPLSIALTSKAMFDNAQAIIVGTKDRTKEALFKNSLLRALVLLTSSNPNWSGKMHPSMSCVKDDILNIALFSRDNELAWNKVGVLKELQKRQDDSIVKTFIKDILEGNFLACTIYSPIAHTAISSNKATTTVHSSSQVTRGTLEAISAAIFLRAQGQDRTECTHILKSMQGKEKRDIVQNEKDSSGGLGSSLFGWTSSAK
jgi:hypothetical protein